MSKSQPPTPDDDPSNPKVSATALDFLLIELVPLAQDLTTRQYTHDQALLEERNRNRIFNPSGQQDTPATGADGPTAGADAGSAITSLGFPVMSDEIREGVFWRLDGMGYRVGQGLVERFSAGKPRPTTPLDAIKFICKDLWLLVFRKQIDNLKTNHRGIFVLTDNRFQPLSRMSVDRRAGPKAAEEAIARAQTYLDFPCGVIRGALSGLGVEVTIEASSTEIPTATFQIKTKGAKA